MASTGCGKVQYIPECASKTDAAQDDLTWDGGQRRRRWGIAIMKDDVCDLRWSVDSKKERFKCYPVIIKCKTEGASQLDVSMLVVNRSPFGIYGPIEHKRLDLSLPPIMSGDLCIHGRFLYITVQDAFDGFCEYADGEIIKENNFLQVNAASNFIFSLFLMMSWIHTYGSSTASVPFTHSPDFSVMAWYWHFLKC